LISLCYINYIEADVFASQHSVQKVFNLSSLLLQNALKSLRHLIWKLLSTPWLVRHFLLIIWFQHHKNPIWNIPSS